MVALAGCLCIATDASAADPDDVAAFSLGKPSRIVLASPSVFWLGSGRAHIPGYV